MELPEVTPKSLVLDLLSRHRGPLTSAQLVRAGTAFEFESGAIRVALSRLSRNGQVTAPHRGHWELTEPAMQMATQVARWRELEARVRPWEGGWLGVATGGLPRSERSVVRRRDRALRMLGLRELRPGLSIRPDNLAPAGPDALRERLMELGLESSAPVAQLGPLGPHQGEAERLWPAQHLSASYRTHLAAIEAADQELDGSSLPQAARQTLLVGGAVLKVLAFDPLLPEPIVDVQARRALRDAMQRFDARGGEIWYRFLESESA